MEIMDYRKVNGSLSDLVLGILPYRKSDILYLLTRYDKSRLFKINSQLVSGIITDCDFKVSSIED